MKGIETWRLIDSGSRLASENMAIDEALLRSCQGGDSLPSVHLYTWKGPAVTLGYLQDVARTIHKEACRAKGIPVVRRITGGRAVIHQEDLGLSLIFPTHGGKIPPGIDGSYRKIAQGLVKGLQSLDIKASLAIGRLHQPIGKREHGHTSACFLTRLRFEVVVSGRKIFGAAQRRTGDWVLQQGTILMDLNRALWMELLHYPEHLEPCKIKKRLASEMTSVREISGKAPDIFAIKRAVVKGLSKILGIRFSVQYLSPQEREEVARLSKAKYRDLLDAGIETERML